MSDTAAILEPEEATQAGCIGEAPQDDSMIAAEPVAEVADAPRGSKRASTVAHEKESNLSPRGGKRASTVAHEKERMAKRPRWGDKSYEEITLGDVEEIVRRCNSLENKTEDYVEVRQQLKELQKSHRELEKREQSLEGRAWKAEQSLEVGPEAAARAKAAVAKQLLAQMTYMPAWNSELKESGRNISAFIPNVSLDLLKVLGGEVGQKTRYAYAWFDKTPSKVLPPQPRPGKGEKGKGEKVEKPGGSGLVLHNSLTLRYIKCHCELEVMAVYKFGNVEKRVKGKGKAKRALADGDALEELSVAAESADVDGADDEDVELGDDGEPTGLSEDVGAESGLRDAADKPKEMETGDTDASSDVALGGQ